MKELIMKSAPNEKLRGLKIEKTWVLCVFFLNFFFLSFFFLNFSRVLRPFLHIIHHPHRGKKERKTKHKGCVVLHWHNESINVNPGINFSAQGLLACAHFLAHLHLCTKKNIKSKYNKTTKLKFQFFTSL